jgi:dCTP deaminase
MYGILTDKTIQAAVDAGTIRIDPFDPKQLNPASYDVTLGDQVTCYKKWVHYDEDYDKDASLAYSRVNTAGPRNGSDLHPSGTYYLDVREEPETVSFKIDPKRGWILKPGIGYLMHTRERIWTDSYVPILDGKSSIGRLFMNVHFCAGFGDPGFSGQYTLEVSVQHSLKVFPGMRIGQIRFHTMHGEVAMDYAKRDSNYKGVLAEGAVPSRAWRQFK